MVLITALTLVCCGRAQGTYANATVPGNTAQASASGTSSDTPPTTSTPSLEAPTATPSTPPPTPTVAASTPQPSPTALPEETYSFNGTGDGQGTVSYSGTRVFEMTVTASWSFECYVNAAPTDPFDLDLPDGQHLWAIGPGGYGSTTFDAGPNFEFSVTALPRCNWTLTGTMTPV